MKIRSRFLIRSLAWVLRLGFLALFATTRKKLVTPVPDISPYGDTKGENYIYCIWHDEIVGAIFSGPTRNCAALVSRHADGSYVADIVEMLGMTPVRGSSNRGGATALRQMMDEAASKHICIATDGPRGPRRIVKDGLVFLASQTGRRVIPYAFAASKMWRPRGSWTDLAIPWPFSTVYIVGSWPITVPENLTREELVPYRERIQAEMDRMNAAAQRLAAGEAVEMWPAAAHPEAASEARSQAA